MKQDKHEEFENARTLDVEPLRRLAQLEDLVAEVDALAKATNRLLVQRRKLQARVKSQLKSVMRSAKQLSEDRVEAVDREFRAAAENALNLEVWFTEFRQLVEHLTGLSREASEEAVAVHEALLRERQQGAASVAEREQAQARMESLEAARRAMAERFEAQCQENELLFQRFSEGDERLNQLEEALKEARAAAATAQSKQAADSSAELQARLTEAEGKYEMLALAREKDRRGHALEIAALTKQLAELRAHYEEQIREPEPAPPIERPAPIERPGSVEPARRPTGGRRRGRLIDTPPSLARSGPARDRPAIFADEDDAPARPSDRPAPPPLPPMAERAAPPPLPPVAPLVVGGAPPPDMPKPQTVAQKELVLFDEERRGAELSLALTEGGFPVTPLAPEPQLIEQLPARSLACLALNLALPGCWSAARVMRGSAKFPPTPMVGYALAPPSPGGFWFGAIDFIVLPADKDALYTALQRVAPRLKQVLVIGTRDELSLAVSRLLARVSVNTSSAADRGQALDVLRTIYPHVLLAHPSSSPIDVFRAIAAIRGLSLFRRTPLVFLLDEKPPPQEETLFSNTARQILRSGNLKPDELPDALALAFSAYVRRVKK